MVMSLVAASWGDGEGLLERVTGVEWRVEETPRRDFKKIARLWRIN